MRFAGGGRFFIDDHAFSKYTVTYTVTKPLMLQIMRELSLTSLSKKVIQCKI
jgi:hypothetical protein